MRKSILAGLIATALGSSLAWADGINIPVFTQTGAWTPVDSSGAALTLTGVSANYTRIGNMVFAYAEFIYPNTANGSNSLIGGLPVTVANQDYATQCTITLKTVVAAVQALPVKNTTTFGFYSSAGAAMTNAQVSQGVFVVMCIYPVS